MPKPNDETKVYLHAAKIDGSFRRKRRAGFDDPLGRLLNDDLHNDAEKPERQALLRRRRTRRFLRFDDRQQIERAWMRLSSLAHAYGQVVGTEAAYQNLRDAILDGQFNVNGRSKLLYKHPWSRRERMTPEWLGRMIETFGDSSHEIINSQYIGCCWVPADMAVAWWQGLPGNSLARKGRRIGSIKYDLTDIILEAKRQLAAQPEGARSKRAAAASAVAICGWERFGASLKSVNDKVRHAL